MLKTKWVVILIFMHTNKLIYGVLDFTPSCNCDIVYWIHWLVHVYGCITFIKTMVCLKVKRTNRSLCSCLLHEPLPVIGYSRNGESWVYISLQYLPSRAYSDCMNIITSYCKWCWIGSSLYACDSRRLLVCSRERCRGQQWSVVYIII